MSTNAGDAARALGQMARDFPRHIKPALATVGKSVAKKSKDAIAKGGRPLDFPKLNAITLALRKRGQTRVRKFGGKLNKSVSVWASTDNVRIGWPEGLSRIGQAFQSEGPHGEMGVKERRYLYRQLLGKGKTPRFTKAQLGRYSHPARMVWPVLARDETIPSEAVRIVSGYIKAMIERAAGTVRR